MNYTKEQFDKAVEEEVRRVITKIIEGSIELEIVDDTVR